MATTSGATVPLSAAQTGNGDSTNVAQRRLSKLNPAAIVLTTTIGATPTVTITISGSVDGTNYYNVPYALVETPDTWVTQSFIVTTATTTTYILKAGQPWKYVKLVYASNTNVTSTASVYFG